MGALVACGTVVVLGCGGGAPGSNDNGMGTGTGTGTPPGQNQQPGSQPPLGSTQTGEGTYYGATGGGNCSYEPGGDLMVAAMNDPQYNNSSVCGMCVDVTGPKGKVTVRIVDRCPECKSGDLDLSEQAFVKIADKQAGRVPISWIPVACATQGPVAFSFKEGSSQYWMGIQIRNSRLPVNKIELQKNGSWLTLAQQQYNYHLDASGPGVGPLTFRATAIDGQQLTQTGIKLMASGVVQGTEQFK